MLAQMGHDDVAEAEDGSGSDGDAVKPITDVTEAKSMLLGLS